jgi:hypothetical protein
LEFDKNFKGLYNAVVSKGIVGMDISQNKSLGELTTSKVEEMTNKEEEEKLKIELERRKQAGDVKAQAERVTKETIDKVTKEVQPVNVDGA